MIPGQLRAMAMSLPEVIERQTWGKPTFRVQNKLFVTLAPDGSSATLKSSLEEQQALIAADPETFTTAAHLGRYGWITIQLDDVDKTQMEELVTDAWRRAAPKGLPFKHHSLSSAVADVANTHAQVRQSGGSRRSRANGSQACPVQ